MAEPISLPDDVLDRFLALIDTSAGESACWFYRGYLNEDGYGRFTIPASAMPDGKKRSVYAHRLAYSLLAAPIDDGLEACHDNSCTTRACCNPAHIRPDTHAENCRDIAVKIASRRPRQLDFGAW